MSRFSEAHPKTIPLFEDGTSSYDLRIEPVQLRQEKDMSLYGANEIVEDYPISTSAFARVASPFNNTQDRVINITHAKDPVNNFINWYAIVRPVSGSDQIWRSRNKVDWTRCTITGLPTNGDLELVSIESSTAADPDLVRSNGTPVLGAVGKLVGTGPAIVKSLDLNTFEYVDSPLTADPANVDKSFTDLAYGDVGGGVWILTSIDDFYIRNTSLDLIDDPANWDLKEGSDSYSYGSIAYGNGIFVAAMRRDLNNRGMVVSENAGDFFYLPDTTSRSSTFNALRYANGYWVCVGYVTNSNTASIYYSSDAENWSQATINGGNYRLLDVDYGDDVWYIVAEIPNTDPNSNRLYYSSSPVPSTFYHRSDILPTGWSSRNVEYGGGISQEWVITSANTADLEVFDFLPVYSGSLFPEDGATSTINVGTITDTHYDSTGTLITEDYNLWQFHDSSVSYKHYFQNAYEYSPMFIASDSFGDIWEIDSDNALLLVSRLGTYHQLYEYPGTYRLEKTSWGSTSLGIDHDIWIEDFYTDQQDSATGVPYSIFRRKADPDEIEFDFLLKLVGQDSNLPKPDFNPTGELGFQEMGHSSRSVIRKMLFMSYELLGIGDVMILPAPEHPNDPPHNKTGAWLQRGYALDTRESTPGTGNYQQINKYVFWVRVSDQESGEDYYVDSDYFTPEGQDSGYVYP